jgi:hypothetical protein
MVARVLTRVTYPVPLLATVWDRSSPTLIKIKIKIEAGEMLPYTPVGWFFLHCYRSWEVLRYHRRCCHGIRLHVDIDIKCQVRFQIETCPPHTYD